MRTIRGQSIATACFVGCLCGMTAPTAALPTASGGIVGVQVASATSCTPWPNPPSISRFTGNIKSVSSAEGVRADITINQPVYVCGAGNSYWVMIHGPSKTVSGCVEGTGTYAQDGWLVGPDYVPKHFYEVSNKAFCDQGSIIWNNASYGTTHPYKTVLTARTGGSTANFYLDGGLMGTLSLDWTYGSAFELTSETQAQENRVGGESFTNVLDCSGSLGCNPGSALDATCGSQYGCAGSTYQNPYGCYLKTSSNSFNVYDSRGNGGHC